MTADQSADEVLTSLQAQRTFTVQTANLTCYQVYVSYGLSRQQFLSNNPQVVPPALMFLSPSTVRERICAVWGQSVQASGMCGHVAVGLLVSGLILRF